MSPYKINGTTITLQPTEGGWIPQDAKGIDGNGHPIYPPTHEFEISWQLISPEDFYQLVQFFDSIGVTGSAVVELPQYRSATWQFREYSGCVIHEPQMDKYWETYTKEAKLLITNIRVA